MEAGFWYYIFAPNKNKFIMEQLNRVQLRGRVGNVRTAQVGEKQVCHFSVATNIVYRGADNQTVEEVTWHNCNFWSNRKYPDLSFIKVGMPVELTGRMKSDRYQASDGTERTSYEILAFEVNALDDKEILKSEVAL